MQLHTKGMIGNWFEVAETSYHESSNLNRELKVRIVREIPFGNRYEISILFKHRNLEERFAGIHQYSFLNSPDNLSQALLRLLRVNFPSGNFVGILQALSKMSREERLKRLSWREKILFDIISKSTDQDERRVVEAFMVWKKPLEKNDIYLKGTRENHVIVDLQELEDLNLIRRANGRITLTNI